MEEKKHISTTALSKKLNMSKTDLDKVLLDKHLIQMKDNKPALTKTGVEAGAIMKKHNKFGEYIAWPEDLDVLSSMDQGNDVFHNSTQIGKRFNLSARKINMILSEIGFTERYLKGWTITGLGKKNGGLQKENPKNGIPFVVWPETLFENSTFKSIIEEVKGNAGETMQKKVDDSVSSNFREKFVAKLRATDGHMVRSKAEMLIDNWLYVAEIVHAYERKLPIEEEMYCDFYIPTGKVYIEYWGLENDPKYAERKRRKKEIYAKYGFKLVELNDEDIFNLDDILPKMLLKFGVQTY